MQNKDTTLMRYNFEDMYKASDQYMTKHQGVFYLFRDMYNRRWDKFFTREKRNMLDHNRWCNYMLNVKEFIRSDLSFMDKAIIIKLASYRDISNYKVYGDTAIKIERIEGIPIERIKKIPLVQIKDNKIKLIFEKEK